MVGVFFVICRWSNGCIVDMFLVSVCGVFGVVFCFEVYLVKCMLFVYWGMEKVYLLRKEVLVVWNLLVM